MWRGTLENEFVIFVVLVNIHVELLPLRKTFESFFFQIFICTKTFEVKVHSNVFNENETEIQHVRYTTPDDNTSSVTQTSV